MKMILEPDPQQISAIQQGDHRSFSALAKLWRDDLYFAAYRLVGDKDAAMDLTQETLLRVFRKANTFEGKGSFRAWVFSTLRNLCLMHLRGKKPEQSLDHLREKDGFDPGEKSHELPLADEAKPPAKTLWEAVNRLPALHREILLHRAQQGLSYKEIADLLNIPVGTVMSRLSTARVQLRRMMEKPS